MKYQPPYGTSDPNAPYINGDPSIARKGSIPPAASIEYPQREIVGLISKSQFVPDDADLLQLTKSARSQFINFADDTGSQNTLSVSFDPPIQAYTVGLPIRVRVKVSNDGPCTIDAGAGRVNIRRPNGAALTQGDLTSGGLVDLVFDGTAFQMINFLGTGGTGTINNFTTNIPYAVDTSPIANQIVCSFSPAITVLAAGQPILVKVANNNTGPTTIKCNALPAVPIYATDDKPLLPCDVIAGGVFMMVFDGTTFIVPPFETIIMPVTINIPSTQFNTPTALFTALERKRIGASGYLTVILAIGIYTPFVVYHSDATKMAIKGTMKAARPVLGNFSMSGNSPAQRSADAAFNLNMLRSRYGTEVQVNPTNGGFAIQIRVGITPSISDMLITCGNTSVGSVGIGDQSVACDNVAVWGCRSGFYADSTGTQLMSACWASACFYGFSSIHGGTMGFNDFTGNGSGAVGCDEAGFSSQAKGYLLLGPLTYSRCNGHYGFLASEFSMLSGINLDGQYNGYSDFTAVNMSMIRFIGLIASLPSSPSIGYEGNNGSWIIGG